MSTSNAPDISAFAAQSQETATATVKQINEIATANKRHIEAAADSSYTIGAQASFATAFIYGTLSINNASYQGYNISFYGTMWGVGFGGGTSYGALTLTVPPSQLNGLKCSFQVTNAAVGVTIQVWCDQYGYVANFTGAALQVGFGVTGGSGTWTATQ